MKLTGEEQGAPCTSRISTSWVFPTEGLQTSSAVRARDLQHGILSDRSLFMRCSPIHHHPHPQRRQEAREPVPLPLRWSVAHPVLSYDQPLTPQLDGLPTEGGGTVDVATVDKEITSENLLIAELETILKNRDQKVD